MLRVSFIYVVYLQLQQGFSASLILCMWFFRPEIPEITLITLDSLFLENLEMFSLLVTWLKLLERDYGPGILIHPVPFPLPFLMD